MGHTNFNCDALRDRVGCAAGRFAHPAHGRSRLGFTLIELLVVVGVIAVLIAILLPSLGAARAQAKAVACGTNLRGLANTAITYAGFNNGSFPLARDAHADWDFSVTTDASGAPLLSPGILWQGGGGGDGTASGMSAVMRVQQCPSYTGRSATLTDLYTGYNYNTSFVGHGVGEATVRSALLSDFRTPSATAIFGDGGYYGGVTNKFMRSPLPYPQSPDTLPMLTRAAGTQDYRHRGATGVAFGDGHAELWKGRSNGGVSIVTPTTGFLAPDNEPYKVQ